MTKKVVIHSYSRRSKSARALAAELSVPIVTRTDPLFHTADVVINWGSSQVPFKHNVLNGPDGVRTAVYKRLAFRRMSYFGVQTPWFITERSQMEDEWRYLSRHRSQIEPDFAVFLRTTATGSGGRGIRVVRRDEMVGEFPEGIELWTSWIRPRAEYRVHVMNGNVIRTQEKRPVRPDADPYIRNHRNGYKFFLGGIHDDMRRDNLAVAGVRACGLDFGAVDIVQDTWGSYYVLEVNTAPGLAGESAAKLYADSFRSSYPL